MKQTVISFILSLLPIMASADANGKCGYKLTWSYVTSTNTLTISGTGEMLNYDEDSRAPWYSYRESIKNAIVKSGVTSIGEYAFADCSALTSITIPNSVTSIGKYAFYNCSGLTSITIPNSVTSIGSSTFMLCGDLTSITIPNSVTSIGEYAFAYCRDLTSITIPNSVTSIGRSAFYKCTGLSSITIPNSMTSIGEKVFYICSGLTSVTIPNSVTSIGSGAFYDCSGLTSITIPNSVTSIGRSAFAGCSGLTSMKVESGNCVYDSRDNCNAIIETGSNTLIAGCKNTKIPNSVTSIGNNAFYKCEYLTSIIIPNSVTSIGSNAFYLCSRLKDVYCMAEKLSSIDNNELGTLYTDKSAFVISFIENATLHVPESAINAYKTIEPWSKFGTLVTASKCATPTISIANGKIHFACTTEGVTFTYNVTASDPSGVGNDITPSSMKLTVYASKPGYGNSDTATIEIATSAGVIGDLTGDGKVDDADRVELTKIIMEK